MFFLVRCMPAAFENDELRVWKRALEPLADAQRNKSVMPAPYYQRWYMECSVCINDVLDVGNNQLLCSVYESVISTSLKKWCCVGFHSFFWYISAAVINEPQDAPNL